MKYRHLLRPELFVLTLMTTIIAMLIVPLPTWLIDSLIAVNMMTAALIFVGSFHVKSVTAFSSFPALLLVTTVFRLSLSITTSRMILMEADAGHIVESFGTFVTGGDLMIGLTVFSIVTLVQFMVITKGSERVAEVCARFSLDGLPGKQMSIDADLRANVINGEQARELRRNLERESQLYGTLDGAVKFVKGDALASILIIFVNFLGGIGMGVVRHGLSFDEALETYTLLTIGDGLVAQLPALLISIATGFIVTRVNADDENLGTTMLKQLGAKGEVLLTAAGLALAAGFLPGFPLPVFVAISACLMAVSVSRFGGPQGVMTSLRALKNGSAASEPGNSSQPAGAEKSRSTEGITGVMPETVALALLIPPGRKNWAQDVGLGAELEREVFLRLGVKIPAVEIRESDAVAANRIDVLVHEIHAGEIRVVFGHRRVITGADMLEALGLPTIDLSEENDSAFWIDPKDAIAEPGQPALPFETHDDIAEVTDRFVNIVARHVTEIFGIQETKNLLDQLETKYPELVKESIRNAPIQRIANVLQRLVSERISIRNLTNILEAVAQWAPKERDNIALAEHVRGTLGRYITEKFSRGKRLNVLVLSPQHEERVRRAIQQSSNGTFLNLPPSDSERLLSDLADRLQGLYLSIEDIVVLSSTDTRRFVKRIIEGQHPKLDVISYGEIADQSRINMLHTI
ncbi:EscV/YscV/HrcV family type III secretion system export apparatus protein [Pseudomonas aeruginosa]|nr:EscV/YscV/HrcV family type III secretion system export apparatus protein [Pseudomonas aeruginosa]